MLGFYSLSARGRELLFRLARRFPRPLLAPAARGLAWLARWRARAAAGPRRLTLFVTNRCDAACRHCFYGDHRPPARQPADPPLERIRAWAGSLRTSLPALLVSGGEPFLRDDLPEILHAFATHAGTRTVTLPTNGLAPARIEETLRRILRKSPGLRLRFQVSVDGPPEVHERIRGVPDAFERVEETIQRVSRLAPRAPALDATSLLVTLGDENVPHLEDLLAYNERNWRWQPKLQAVRSAATEAFGLAPDRRSDLNAAQMQLSPAGWIVLLGVAIRLYGRPVLAERFALTCLLVTAQAALEQRPVFPCQAGVIEGVIHPEGRLAPCEFHRPVLSLDDFGDDLGKAWASPPMEDARTAAARCGCAHDCNVASSLLYDDALLMRLFESPFETKRRVDDLATGWTNVVASLEPEGKE